MVFDSGSPPNAAAELRPYHERLISKYFPREIAFYVDVAGGSGPGRPPAAVLSDLRSPHLSTVRQVHDFRQLLIFELERDVSVRPVLRLVIFDVWIAAVEYDRRGRF